MQELVEGVSYINNLLFVALAFVAFRTWRKQGGEAAAWVAATFASLAFIAIVLRLLPDETESGWVGALRKVTFLGIVFFPFALYRFTTALKRSSTITDRLALAITLLVGISTFLVDRPGADEPRSAAYQLYVVGLLLQWGGLLTTVAVRLWRAGRGQPTLARRRMRLLSVASIGITLALIVGLQGSDVSNLVRLVVRLVTTASVGLFFLGFAPPAWLRIAWRRPEQERLRHATEQLVRATTQDEVIETLLPHVTSTLGARGASLVSPDGRMLGAHGDVGSTNPDAHEPAGDVVSLEFGFGRLVIWVSPYTPFFGRDELELLSSLGILTGLALDRTQLYQREQATRESLQRVNRELQATNDRLEELNAEMESFVYTVSHDLNSPIIAIQGFADFLEKDHAADLPERGRFYIQRINASADYLQSLIKDLLAFSRVGRVQKDLEPVDLGEVVRQACDEARARCPDLQLHVGDLPVVYINPLRARQLFTNLIQNSCRYAGRPDVVVTVSSEPVDGDVVPISVRDNGPGVPAEYRRKVFGVFERLHQEGAPDGSGMGLPICKRIVETTGGSMWIEDSDSGLDVRFTLPLQAPARVEMRSGL